MSEDTWRALEREFGRFPMLRSDPVTEHEISAVESVLNGRFSPDYREFVMKYGGAIVGAFSIFGLRQPEAMGSPWSVTDVTMRFRNDGWPGTDRWCVISTDGFGNPIGLASDGAIYISDHDSKQTYMIASTFEQFLKQCLVAE
jgi:hypothetical protein